MAPDLVYASRVPDMPDPGLTNFDKQKLCALVLIAIGFSRDLGCDKKHIEKTEKNSSLIAALQQYRGRVEFAAIPIGHAGTKLTRTLDHLTAITGTSQPIADSNAGSHDYRMFKSMVEALADLAQSRLLGIRPNYTSHFHIPNLENPETR